MLNNKQSVDVDVEMSGREMRDLTEKIEAKLW